MAPLTPDPESVSPEELAQELGQALALGQFFLVYQPTIDLQTNAFAGVEALIRWRHPVRGVVNPETFISELESSGQIVPVGRWALDTACAQAAQWHAKGYRFAVSVNISGKQLELVELVEDVADALSSSRFDPSLLVLEFAQKFHIDIVKLDKGFIAGITDSSEAADQIHSLVQLAKTLGVQIFASGIEDVNQRQRLQSEEVDIGQGFLFSTPHEAAQIDRFLEDFAIFSGKPL
jgi:EAL domain-containing protein (putative c-di-GMP-specific phosphodiesterase class I)